MRQRAQLDPGLALDGLALPCLIDEAQYAPNLFPEIKRRIDAARRERLRQSTVAPSTSYFLTGSSKLQLDRGVKESEVAGAAGVDQKTVTAWIHLLEINGVVQLLPTFSTNLSKRLTRLKKLHFMDTGLCVRLQGHADPLTTWNSPQIGALFESLVHGEIIKTRDNFLLDWQLHTWRTKDQTEVDWVIQLPGTVVFIEAKLAVHGARPFQLDREAQRVFSPPHDKIVVTAGNDVARLDRETMQVPVHMLGAYLLDKR